MSRFNWFGSEEHRVFNYKPMYYDEKEEERRKKLGNVDGSLDKKTQDGTYTPGSYIRGSFTNGNYARRRGDSRVRGIITVIGLILFFLVMIYITKFYSLL